jgi:hypothetical protein
MMQKGSDERIWPMLGKERRWRMRCGEEEIRCNCEKMKMKHIYSFSFLFYQTHLFLII